MRRPYLIWLILGLIAAGGVVAAVVISISEGDGAALALTLGFTILAALAAAAGTFITWKGNRENAVQQKQMADDIRRLTELTEGSIEEARAQRPAPELRFAVKNQGVEAASLARTRIERPLDVDAILELERRRAMATLPKPPKPGPEPDAAQSAVLGPAFAGLQKMLADQAKVYDQLGGAFGFAKRTPATEEEKAEFEEKVEAYLGRVRKWLTAYERWEQERHELVRVTLRFENDGRVPCVGGIYEVHFPDPFEQGPDEYPELEGAPSRPKFTRPGPWSFPNLMVPATFDIPRVSPIDTFSNVSNTRFRKGSVIVEVGVKKLLHGVTEDSDPFLLRAPNDGAFTVPWQIHAENLPEAVSGELRLELITKIERGEPIKDLEELLALIWPDEGQDSGTET